MPDYIAPGVYIEEIGPAEVRRLASSLGESIDESIQWAVFEPNDETTWSKVRQTINDFLLSVWRNGTLRGSTPDKAFFVRCDRTTTQEDIASGRLICVIGVAIVKPAEFVVIRIEKLTGAPRS